MGYKDNAMLLSENKVNLDSGAYSEGVYLCVEAGDLTVVWSSGETDTISCLAGDAFMIKSVQSVTISSGKFHYQNRA